MPSWSAGGAVASRAEAHAAVEAHRVLVNGAVADKPARLVAAGDALVIAGPPARFVGRGGDKLDAALEQFEIDVDRPTLPRRRCVDGRVHGLPARTGSE